MVDLAGLYARSWVSPAPKYRPHLVLEFQAYTEEAVIETCLCIGCIFDLFYDR